LFNFSGPPGSNVEHNCQKLVNEFKYNYISIQDLINVEKEKIREIIKEKERGKQKEIQKHREKERDREKEKYEERERESEREKEREKEKENEKKEENANENNEDNEKRRERQIEIEKERKEQKEKEREKEREKELDYIEELETEIRKEKSTLILSNEKISDLFMKDLITKKANTFLVSGFPNSIDQALYVEKFINDIKVIINFENTEETSIIRQKSASKENLNEDVLKRNFKNYKELSFPLKELYQKYGVIRTVNSDLSDSEIYKDLKENLYPEIYCIIGKKYSGKTMISNVLMERTGINYINFPAFLAEPNIAKKINDDEYVIQKFISKLRENESRNVLIEDFPLKKEYYTIFVQNCKNFKKIFYLNADNNECSERMRKLGKNHKDYIGCCELNKFLTDFELKNSYIEFLRSKCGDSFLEMNVNKVFKLVTEDLIQKIAPKIFLFNSNQEGSIMREMLIHHFKERLDYKVIDLEEIQREYINRNHKIGKLIDKAYETVESIVPNSLKIEALKPILFNPKNDKFILINYPQSQMFISEFEEKVSKISQYIYVTKISPLEIKLEKSEIEIYFKKNNRFFNYKPEEIDEYVINDILGINRDFNIAYGLPNAGDNIINSHLAKNYNHRLIDLNKFIEELKIKQAGPEGDVEGTIIDLPTLLREFKLHLKNTPKKEKICIDNLINPVITDFDGVIKLLEVLGRPRFFFEIFCNEKSLIEKHKLKNEIAEDLNEEQKAEFEKSLETPKKIMEFLRDYSFKNIKVDTSFADWKVLNNFDFNFGRNLIIIKHDYNINIENCLYLTALTNKILYINVPYLIYRQFYLNNSWSEKLENCYRKKNLKIEDFSDFERMVYKSYNPLHFHESVVNDLILNYINENSKENEDSDNLVILSGYINYDIIQDDESPFNLPIYEVKKLLNIGK
jgi:adenylate kinase family enzyme